MRTICLFALAAGTLLAETGTTKVYVDPASIWESLHDANGSGAPAELSGLIAKACPSVTVTRSADDANYVVLVTRKTGSGSAVIYKGKEAVLTFSPGFGAKLQKVADKVCEFAASRH